MRKAWQGPEQSAALLPHRPLFPEALLSREDQVKRNSLGATNLQSHRQVTISIDARAGRTEIVSRWRYRIHRFVGLCFADHAFKHASI